MRKIVYYVAISLDGFIAGPNGDISGFAHKGSGVDQYLKDLQGFDTVIMGRKTYEFGYQYGLQPGQPAYSHMDHYIFSNSLTFDQPHEKVHIGPPDITTVRQLKEGQGADIYLCGGGTLAGWLLEHKMIDLLKIKLNPLVLGQGTHLFGNSRNQHQLELKETKRFDEGLQIMTYRIKYV